MLKGKITEDRNILVIISVYIFLLLFFCSQMSPLYPINEWPDVNLYFNLGKAAFNGKVIYSEAFDHKGPLIFVIYGVGYLISNSGFLGMYLIESVCWIAMAFTAYYTARLLLDRVGAFAVAVLFPLFMLTHTAEGGSAEEFIAIFMVLSLFLFIRYFKEDSHVHSPTEMLIHGILFSAVVLVKINLAIFWFFPLAAIFISILVKRDYKNLVYNLAAFIAGILVVMLPFAVYFYVNNSLAEAWDIYIVLNRSYATIGTFTETIELLAGRFYMRVRHDTLNFIIIIVGAFWFPLKHLKSIAGKIAIPLAFISVYCAIFVTPLFIFYYSIPYYIFGLLGFISIFKYIRLVDKRIVYAAFVILALYLGIREKDFFGFSTDELKRKTVKETAYNHFSSILAEEEDTTLMNLMLDGNNAVFTLLNIKPNVKYFISPNIMYDMYPQMRDTQTNDIRQKKVRYIILSEKAFDFEYFYNLPVLNQNYDVADRYTGQDGRNYYLYKRKD